MGQHYGTVTEPQRPVVSLQHSPIIWDSFSTQLQLNYLKQSPLRSQYGIFKLKVPQSSFLGWWIRSGTS